MMLRTEIGHLSRHDVVFLAFGSSENAIAPFVVRLGLDIQRLRRAYGDARERLAGAFVADGAYDRFARRCEPLKPRAVQPPVAGNPALGRSVSSQGIERRMSDGRSPNGKLQN